MSENTGLETHEEGNIWEGWDDGFREREEGDSPYTIIRRVTRCPHCRGNLVLNYSARGITFKHDDDRWIVRLLRWATDLLTWRRR